MVDLYHYFGNLNNRFNIGEVRKVAHDFFSVWSKRILETLIAYFLVLNFQRKKNKVYEMNHEPKITIQSIIVTPRKRKVEVTPLS